MHINIKDLNGNWMCPVCKNLVGTSTCKCGLSYFIYERKTKIIFYKKREMFQVSNKKITGKTFKTYSVSPEGFVVFENNNSELLENFPDGGYLIEKISHCPEGEFPVS